MTLSYPPRFLRVPAAPPRLHFYYPKILGFCLDNGRR